MFGRTDEGVCPYKEVHLGTGKTILTNFRKALLPLGEAGWGFQRGRLSLPCGVILIKRICTFNICIMLLSKEVHSIFAFIVYLLSL